MKITISQYEDSNEGIIANTNELAEMCNEDSKNFQVIQFARKICSEYQAKGHSEIEKATAIFYWVKRHIKYINDPINAELYQDSITTIREGMGDCDDHVILCCSLNMAVGNLCRAVLIDHFEKDRIEHIYYEVLTKKGWYPFDTTAQGSFPGWLPPNESLRVAVYMDGRVESIGFISKLIKELRRVFRKFEKTIIRKPFQEARRFARKNFKDIYLPISRLNRKIQAERRRFEERLAKELDRFASEFGPASGLVKTLVKVVFISQVKINVLGISKNSPLKFTDEELQLLVGIALTALSAGAFAAGNVVGLAVTQSISAINTSVEVRETLKQKKELLEEVKKIRAQFLLQEQALFEVRKKLEKDIEFLEIFDKRQQEIANELAILQDENNKEINLIERIQEEKRKERIRKYKEELSARKQEIIEVAKVAGI